MMWGDGFTMGWAMWLLMGTAFVGFWIVVILVVRALLPDRTSRRDDSAPRPDPLILLKETLARGEITPEEYEQRRRLLNDGH